MTVLYALVYPIITVTHKLDADPSVSSILIVRQRRLASTDVVRIHVLQLYVASMPIVTFMITQLAVSVLLDLSEMLSFSVHQCEKQLIPEIHAIHLHVAHKTHVWFMEMVLPFVTDVAVLMLTMIHHADQSASPTQTVHLTKLV